MAFSKFQQRLVDELQKARDPELTESRAKIIAAAATQELARPIDAFVDALKHYSGLADQEQVKRDVDFLRHQGIWLSSNDSYGEILVHAARDIERQIDRITASRISSDDVLNERKLHLPNINVVGPMTSDLAFTGFLERIASAKKEICLPMSATTPHIGVASILEERAQTGVSVKLLLASPDTAKKLHGAACVDLAKAALAGWRQSAHRGGRNFKIRIARDPADVLMASCACVDGKFLRLDVYDHQKQKSLEGQLIEVHAEQNGYRLNIIGLFEGWFNQTWSRSQPSEKGDFIGWVLTTYWHYWIAIVCLLAALQAGVTSGLGTAAASIGGTLLVTGMVETSPMIKRRIDWFFGYS